MFFDALIDFVFPKVCVGCGVWGSFLCKDCVDRLDFVDQVCPMCGEKSLMGWTHPRCKSKWGMDGLISIYEYQEPIARAVIDGIKYGFNRELARIVLKDFRFETGERFDMLVPVPLYFYRENWRGFNQARELAEVIGSKLLVRVENVLERKRNTKQQVTMKTKEEREENIRGAFKISEKFKNSKLKKLKILLVDDVFTSGADMRECVWGLSLSH
ncbi:MAG: Phosphoribosyltransferase [Candidatus Collierbacteria bacterium GW2011_GWB1_45_35]|nr:MAG: Phosphoribosyltransferase [Candidatus Collierbacteria bacterium GW2011_GWB1_45_35]